MKSCCAAVLGLAMVLLMGADRAAADGCQELCEYSSSLECHTECQPSGTWNYCWDMCIQTGPGQMEGWCEAWQGCVLGLGSIRCADTEGGLLPESAPEGGGSLTEALDDTASETAISESRLSSAQREEAVVVVRDARTIRRAWQSQSERVD